MHKPEAADPSVLIESGSSRDVGPLKLPAIPPKEAMGREGLLGLRLEASPSASPETCSQDMDSVHGGHSLRFLLSCTRMFAEDARHHEEGPDQAPKIEPAGSRRALKQVLMPDV